MLLYTKIAAAKQPKRRSRAGCVHCKEKKKKCNEKRPQCKRCEESNLQCIYEAVKPRKRRRTSFAGSALSHGNESPTLCNDRWPGRFDYYDLSNIDGIHKWESGSYQYAGSDESLEWDIPYDNGVEVEHIKQSDLAEPSTNVVHSRSQYPDLAMVAPSPVVSPLFGFSTPVFQEFTPKRNRRALVDHFCNVLSHLIVFKEDTGNPFRQLVLPLSHASSPVMNAIFALSSAHLEYRGVENEEKSLDFHNKALHGVGTLIAQREQSNCDEVLGAIILLIYFETLVQRGNSNIITGHLKGAMTIMQSASQVRTPTTAFLERAFRFYDVITALSLGTPPNTSIQSCSSSSPISPVEELPTELSPLSAVDTLLGFSTELWPIIHRLSHLLAHKQALEAAVACGETSKATVLRTELESTAQAIELALTNWKPTGLPQVDEDEDPCSPQNTRIQSIVNNAEAYRHSAFVYLYRTIQSQPRSDSLLQKHTHLSLVACSSVVNFAEQCQDGPMSALLWPLFVASCEAMRDEDRELASNAFCGTERRQGMNNIMRTWEVVQEVWRRADLGEDVVDWRTICAEKGFSIVFG